MKSVSKYKCDVQGNVVQFNLYTILYPSCSRAKQCSAMNTPFKICDGHWLHCLPQPTKLLCNVIPKSPLPGMKGWPQMLVSKSWKLTVSRSFNWKFIHKMSQFLSLFLLKNITHCYFNPCHGYDWVLIRW